MELQVNGDTTLTGITTVPGSKNGALALMAGALLLPGITTLRPMPANADVLIFCRILNALGVATAWPDRQTLQIHADTFEPGRPPVELCGTIRASIYLLGPMLARFGWACAPRPGGCSLGRRPVDLHLKALRSLGAHVSGGDGEITVSARRLQGGLINVRGPYGTSVGATVNALLAAAGIRDTTIIHGAAREPEVLTLAAMLQKSGVQVAGAGTNTLFVRGGVRFGDITHTVLPDRIIAGTLLIGAAATRGDVTVTAVPPDHLGQLLPILAAAGCRVETWPDSIRVRGPSRLRPVTCITEAHPGLATDLQPVLGSALTQASGVSSLCETVFPERFAYLDQLARMGARFRVQDNVAHLFGPYRLRGATVTACDLRAGAALVIAGLLASGRTHVCNARVLERGWPDLEKQLNALGAQVQEVTRPNPVAVTVSAR